MLSTGKTATGSGNPVTEGAVEANGVRHRYLSAGSGPLVVLLHGFPDTADGWVPVMERLAAQGYRALAPNLRGYPPSGPAPDGDYSLVAGARDVLGIAAALGAERVAVVGVDWGSFVAYTAANVDPARVWKVAGSTPHPRMLRTWRFLHPAQLWRVRHMALHQMPGLAEWIARRRDFAYIDRLHRRWSPGWAFEPDMTEAVKQSLAAPGGLSGALGWYRCLAAMQLAPWKADERCIVLRPTTVEAMTFAGTTDAAVPAALYEDQEPAFPGGHRMVWLDGAGHVPQRERPDETAIAIVDFLNPDGADNG
jgi:pimeloyl-ACP methyl ester carboxylesterase